MNLVKNVTGSWDSAKDLVRQDLDTIQRTINQILAQINTPGAAAASRPATISPENFVTTYGSDPLTVVAIAPGELMTGNGTITNPLKIMGLTDATLTVSQIKTLNSVPIELIAAPGPSKLIRVWKVTYRYISGASGFGNNPNTQLVYGTTTTPAITTAVSLGYSTLNLDRLAFADNTVAVSVDTPANWINKAVNIMSTADGTGTPTGITLRVRVLYSVIAM